MGCGADVMSHDYMSNLSVDQGADMQSRSLSVIWCRLVRVAFLFLTLTGILLTFTDPPDRRFQLRVFSWTREIRRETSRSFQNELLINADKVRGEVTSAQSVSAQPTKPVCAC